MSHSEPIVVHDVDVGCTIVLAHPYVLHHEAQFEDVLDVDLGGVSFQTAQHSYSAAVIR
jgi:hypothetical protein